jgi:hypothetical protein
MPGFTMVNRQVHSFGEFDGQIRDGRVAVLTNLQLTSFSERTNEW